MAAEITQGNDGEIVIPWFAIVAAVVVAAPWFALVLAALTVWCIAWASFDGSLPSLSFDAVSGRDSCGATTREIADEN